MKTNQLTEKYQTKINELSENIVAQPWSGDISNEEKTFIDLVKKLKPLNKDKYNMMAKKYNAVTNAREDAYLLQKRLDKLIEIKDSKVINIPKLVSLIQKRLDNLEGRNNKWQI